MPKYFLDIPIYRCSVDKHTVEMENGKLKHLQYLVDTHSPKIKNSKTYKWAEDYFDKEKWYPWRYNEIIGWVRLYTIGPEIRGELWFINAKKIMKTLKNKKFFFMGKAFEMLVDKSFSSDDIFNSLHKELDQLKSSWPIKGRFLDTELFESIGRFINWKSLLGFDET